MHRAHARRKLRKACTPVAEASVAGVEPRGTSESPPAERAAAFNDSTAHGSTELGAIHSQDSQIDPSHPGEAANVPDHERGMRPPMNLDHRANCPS